MNKYDHSKIEEKWQKKWKEDDLYKTEDKVKGKDNYYTLVEFAYPSGNLHVGHWYAFSIPDMYARFMRMKGKNVLFPFGFDSFGLPAENAAIQRKLNPRDWTNENVAYMRKQLGTMGTMFDWSREVVTSDPSYYKWTQWLFLQMFEKGLAYQAETMVNWCPSCKTVLANEQVKAGLCERCETEVEQKQMKQWMLRITDYADRLVDDLEALDWPESIKASQRAWIGRSHGAELSFAIKDSDVKVPVFTTRPDTLFGATYMVIAPEHDLVQKLKRQITNWDEVEEYIKKAGKKTELERQENKDKTGVELKGVRAINPANNEETPVWLADYVLSGYGTGAIMAVPAHDERDFAFAKKFSLPVVEVISGGDESLYTGEGTLINSGKFDGMSTEEARAKITKTVGGEMKTTYKLRDWGISRQRYWGCPIPIIHCDKCGQVAEESLPVELPDVEDYLPSGDGRSPLAKVDSFVNVSCPKCGGKAKRETDTMDTFMDSSWYFLRYLDSQNDKEFASKKSQKDWMPVDFYSGGAEHTTMHVLYSRFFQKALHDLKLVYDDEPYKRRMNRSLILGPDGNKMSKSKGNVIDPDDVVSRLGADTVRMYLAFIGPFNEVNSYPWSPDGIVGVRRFIERVWRVANERLGEGNVSENVLHKAIKDVTEIITRVKFNTAVSTLMVLVSEMDKSGVSKEQCEVLIKLLAPFAPHIAEEIWRDILGHKTSIHLEEWPRYDESLVQEQEVVIGVQINGKVRGEVTITPDSDEESVKREALLLDGVQKHLDGREPEQIIYVPGKIVNIVVKG